jgi:hypothetical protein
MKYRRIYLSHKLQIAYTREQLFSEQIKKWLEDTHYLKPFDLVRGIECTITLYIKNIGNEGFPGCLAKSIVINYSGGVRHDLAPFEVPEIEADQERRVPLPPIIAIVEGPGSIEIEFSSKDGKPIECYQRRTDRPIGINRWLDVFYVISREILNIMWRLDRLGR